VSFTVLPTVIFVVNPCIWAPPAQFSTVVNDVWMVTKNIESCLQFAFIRGQASEGKILESCWLIIVQHKLTQLLIFQGRWFYALLASTEKPLPPETCALLRRLSRNCWNLRATLVSVDRFLFSYYVYIILRGIITLSMNAKGDYEAINQGSILWFLPLWSNKCTLNRIYLRTPEKCTYR
jgi:hypothetical protein